MTAVRLGSELEARLDNLTKKTGHTKTYFIKKALDKFLEDQEDYLLAVEALKDKRPALSLDEVRRRLGLED